MFRIADDLRMEVERRGLWSAFMDVCERRLADGVKNKSSVLDDAIDAVVPDLKQYKRRKVTKCIAARQEDAVRSDAKCSGFEMLKWALENYDNKSATPFRAPSKDAWSLLNLIRKFEDSYAKMFDRYVVERLKRDAANGDTGDARLDGQVEYDIMDDELRRMGVEVRPAGGAS